MEHPHLELVGVWVHDQAKVGVDAGELAGVEPCGLAATKSVDAVLALGADCVLYMPRALDADVLCRILASGASVVTTRGEFHHPPTMDPELRTRRRGSVLAGRYVDPQHRRESGIHHRGRSPRVQLDPAGVWVASGSRSTPTFRRGNPPSCSSR